MVNSMYIAVNGGKRKSYGAVLPSFTFLWTGRRELIIV